MSQQKKRLPPLKLREKKNWKRRIPISKVSLTLCDRSRGDHTRIYIIGLAKFLEAARVSSTRPASVPSAEAHAGTLNELDVSRLSLAKSISDVEGVIASREAELAALKEETRTLEDYDPASEHEKELDGAA